MAYTHLRGSYAESRRRAAEIAERYDAGMSIIELAGRYNLTYQRVHQIVTAPPRGKIRAKKNNKTA